MASQNVAVIYVEKAYKMPEKKINPNFDEIIIEKN